MTASGISAADPYARKRVAVLDSEIAYVETGAGRPVVFLHGNPTSSYLWRNVIPHVEGVGRCLAPDLIGMGESGRPPAAAYRFVDHVRYMDAWFEAAGVETGAVLVGHDWGSAIAFHWARRHPRRVAGIVYMEAIVKPSKWADWPEEPRKVFQAMRSAEGEELVLEKNLFVERILPSAIERQLTEAEHDVYRRPYLEPGDSRLPTLVWPRELPIEGEPEDVVRLVEDYGAWLAESPVPKLFINAEPGRIMARAGMREFVRGWPNQEELTVAGLHYVQEDAPREIGEAIAGFIGRL